ncbi:2-oxo acid dehydrogenase subunit E2 [Bacillus sp. AFS031507]|uniref:2-oxo acid dehydrogenase subunit E2 n=1 Tax=Bacillus sp. AFS031507 TaxID=2033496 RepID=UPI0027B91D1C|nr:2-oxo acid dehydrogenase subunit E2 [Bacillus sp. AFS031507]
MSFAVMWFYKSCGSSVKAISAFECRIEEDELEVKKFYDIRIAMAAPEGLLVPVVMRIRKFLSQTVESLVP